MPLARSWGKLRCSRRNSLYLGNTHTLLGKTDFVCFRHRTIQKHPHSFGKDRLIKWFSPDKPGNTPTLVGKTAARALPSAVVQKHSLARGENHQAMFTDGCIRKHPHARGEDAQSTAKVCVSLETPPRSWGRLRDGIGTRPVHGNTPTLVGKTRRCPREFLYP